jgi:hypothetical protein
MNGLNLNLNINHQSSLQFQYSKDWIGIWHWHWLGLLRFGSVRFFEGPEPNRTVEGGTGTEP